MGRLGLRWVSLIRSIRLRSREMCRKGRMERKERGDRNCIDKEQA